MLELLFAPIVAELKKIGADVVKIKNLLALLVIPIPGPLKPVLVAEKEDNMLVYKVEFPPNPGTPADLTLQKFSVSVSDAVVFNEDYPMSVNESGEFKVNDNDEVTLALAYADDAGNIGGSTTQTFTAVDTIAPDAPGPFGAITLIREE